MKLITLITNYGLLNPLTPMFYSIFIKNRDCLHYLYRSNSLLYALLIKGIENPENRELKTEN